MAAMTRRTFLKGASAGAAGLATGPLLSGCGSDAGSEKRLQFWAFTDTRIEWQKQAFELYKREKQPDFEIDWLVLPFRQMHDQLLITAQAGSGGPDIADVEVSQFPRFVKGDVLFHDLKPKLVEMGEWDNLYHASATDPWSFDGKAHGIGNELNTCLFAYRWDVLEKAGIDPDIATWDVFIERAKEFHDKTGHHLLDFEYTDWSTWWKLALQQGGGFFDQNGRPSFDDKIGVKTLAWMQAGIDEGWAVPTPVGQAYNVALEEGRIASQIGPSWLFSGFNQQNIPDTEGKWRLAPFPRWEPGGSRTATHGGTGVAVSRLSENAEAAMDFVLWEHTNTQALLQDFELRQVWPTYRPAFGNEALTKPLKFFDGQRVGDLMREVSPEINTVYTSPFWTEATDAFVRVALTPAIQSPATSTDAVLAEAKGEAEKLIDLGSA